MSHWQERINRETPPAIVAEHTLRYRASAPLIGASAVWADLGCGNGMAAAAVLRGQQPSRVILVDLEASAVDRAAQELGIESSLQIDGDLTSADLLARIEAALREIDGARTVTCFEVVEHLSTFLPFIEWAGALAGEGVATFVMSVPNDAFWSIENPFHASRWGEGAFDELCRVLPPEHTLLRQVALAGSALVAWDDSPERHQVAVDVGGDGSAASHFIVAFGPRHREVSREAVAVPAQQLDQRRWERQRESNLAFAEAVMDAQLSEIRDLRAEMDDWRTYIHELERELGRPLSGVEPDAQS